jgi:hypothetical protein
MSNVFGLELLDMRWQQHMAHLQPLSTSAIAAIAANTLTWITQRRRCTFICVIDLAAAPTIWLAGLQVLRCGFAASRWTVVLWLQGTSSVW